MNAISFFAEEAAQTRKPLKPYTAPLLTGGPVYERLMLDIDFLVERFRRLPDRPLGQSDAMEASKTDLCELLLSAAATASLVGYGRPDDKWRLEVVKQDSTHGKELLEALDGLSIELRRADRVLRRFFQDRRSLPCLKRCAALCALALDAVPAFQIQTYACFGGVQPASQDPHGDAQVIAEEHDYAGTIPLTQNA
jgi:hypothetical protein